MILSSTRLSSIAEELRAAAATIDDVSGATSRQLDEIEGALGDVAATSEGPAPDGVRQRAADYRKRVESAPDVLAGLHRVLTDRARLADVSADDLRAAEATLGTIGALVDRGLAEEEFGEQRANALATIDSIEAQWSRSMHSLATRVATDAGHLRMCRDAIGINSTDPHALDGASYVSYVASYAVLHDIDLALLDPSGNLAEQAGLLREQLTSTDPRALFFQVMETAKESGHYHNQGVSIGYADGVLTSEDVEYSNNPVVVSELVRLAAEEQGIELDDAQVAEITDEIIAGSWLLRAAVDEDDWQDIELELQPIEPAASTSRSPSDERADAAPVDGTDAVLDGTGLAAEVVLPAGGLKTAVGGAGHVLGALDTLNDCTSDDGNCAASVVMLGADTVGSIVAPVVYPVAKWVTIGSLFAVGQMMEQSPNVEPNWTGMGTGPGVEPHEADRTTAGLPPQSAPNGANMNGTLDYGGPDCAALEFYGESHRDC